MKKTIIVYCLLFVYLQSVSAEDGSRLWLRFDEAKTGVGKVISKLNTPIVSVASEELNRYWQGQPVELIIDKKLRQIKDGYRIKGDQNKITISASRGHKRIEAYCFIKVG